MPGSQANHFEVLRDFCLIFRHQDHLQSNNKNGGKIHRYTNVKCISFLKKIIFLKIQAKREKKDSYQTFTTYLICINLV